MGVRRRIRKSETPSTEWIPVDLTKIIADLPVPFVRVLELQDVARPLRHGDFHRMAAVACWSVGLGVSSCVGGKSDISAASCWMLLADVEIGVERAFVDDCRLSWSTRAGFG